MKRVVIVDTSIFIASWRGDVAAHELLRRVAQHIRLHPIVEAELVCGARNKAHLGQIVGMLEALPRVSIKNADMFVALQLLRDHHLPNGIGWPDCMIAASCLRTGARLATLNIKHFRCIHGLQTQQPA